MFATSIAFKMVHFAWFNYTTHRPVEGKFQTRNLTQGLYFAINWISFGFYYHDNHHKNPTLFNPKYMPDTPQKRKPSADEAAA